MARITTMVCDFCMEHNATNKRKDNREVKYTLTVSAASPDDKERTIDCCNVHVKSAINAFLGANKGNVGAAHISQELRIRRVNQ